MMTDLTLTRLLTQYVKVLAQNLDLLTTLNGYQAVIRATLSDDPAVRDRAHDILYDEAVRLQGGSLLEGADDGG